ncbi:MAG: hypothetical protein CMF25_03085 [Kangiellaceae bacterium]|nr:hypothetical protein [Kangiellaceae bacterium]|tara:strand:- start:7260 stop:8177 length:918 start_codon:yes stop_codon:yes gene_type:complete
MTKPSISVVISLFNKEKLIDECLSSVTEQTSPAMEIIVVDDDSTDNGVLAVKRWQKQHKNIYLYQQSRQGLPSARNKAVHHAKGEIVAFIEAGDSWSPHHLANVEALATQYPSASLYTTGYQLCIDNLCVRSPKIRHLPDVASPFAFGNYFEIASNGDLPINISGLAIARAKFLKLGGFPEGETMAEEQHLYAKAALDGPMAKHPMVTAFTKMIDRQTSTEISIPQTECLFSRHLTSIPSSCNEPQRQQLTKYCARHLLEIAQVNIQRGFYDLAQEILDDQRTNALPWHRTYWQCQLVARQWLYG